MQGRVSPLSTCVDVHWIRMCLVATIVALGAGCRADLPAKSAAAHSRHGSAPPLRATPLTRLDVVVAARAVCDSVAAEWRAVKGVDIRQTDTSVTPGDDVLETDSVSACLTEASDPDGVSAHSSAPLYWPSGDVLPNAWPRRWGELWHLMADGPGSSRKVVQRDLVRCEIRVESDIGDPSDSVAPPLTDFTEATICRAAAPLKVSDTARSSPRVD